MATGDRPAAFCRKGGEGLTLARDAELLAQIVFGKPAAQIKGDNDAVRLASRHEVLPDSA